MVKWIRWQSLEPPMYGSFPGMWGWAGPHHRCVGSHYQDQSKFAKDPSSFIYHSIHHTLMMAKHKQAIIHHIGATNSLGGKKAIGIKQAKLAVFSAPLTQPGLECVGSDYWDHPAKKGIHHTTTLDWFPAK